MSQKIGDFFMKKVCVIGGGPAGLMASYAAAKNGHEVILIEKNEKLGKKIYITGKGRCNFTNDVAPDEFLQNVVRGDKFLRGSIYTFSPQKVIEFFENYGLLVKIERGNRAFPNSDHASDVTKTLEKACKSVGVTVVLNEKVEEILTTMPDIIPMSDIACNTMQGVIPMSGVIPKKQAVAGVKTNRNTYFCDVVIVATGGLSYPTTGSTGDGYIFAKQNGHTVTDLKCGLCGLNLSGNLLQSLQGLTLKNVVFSVKNGAKVVFSELGEMLFTHFGISGPLVLSASSKINRLPLLSLQAEIDLKPALDAHILDKRLLRDFEKYKNKQISNALIELLPSKMIGVVLKLCKIDEKKSVNTITKEERAVLVSVLKGIPCQIRSLRGFEEAIITSGGVELAEINPKTMESKKIDGLKFCGEVLDIDAFTGGFNMQIAFSTGFVAGNTVV